MDKTSNIGSLITSDESIRSGRPRIAGTGVTVQTVVQWYKSGATPEEIADNFGHLTLAQVHAALAFYHANRDLVEADLMTEDRLARQLERQHAPRLAG